MAAPSKEQQRAEAEARAQSGIDPGEGASALDVIDNDSGADLAPGTAPRQAAPAEGEAAPRPLPTAKGQYDDKRNAIIGRFRTDRGAEAAENRDDISDFARSGMPPEFSQPNSAVAIEQEEEAGPETGGVQNDPPEPAAGAAPAAAAAPQMVKIKVDGVEREVPLDEALGKAQIAYASDNLFEKTKTRFKEADTLLETLRDKVARVDQPGGHHARPTHTQSTEADATTGAQGDPPDTTEDPLGKLIETIQFGDPQEAQSLLRDTIAREATKAVSQNLEQQRFQDEGARTSKVLKDFEDQHADLAKDPMARAAIEAKVVEQQLDDIKALGIEPLQLRGDGQPPTPGDIANAHRFYRAKGFKVTAPQDLLQGATDKFLAWKGDKAPTPKPADPANPPGQQHVDITVDRTARRQAIPQQPARAAAPRQPAPSAQPVKPRDRSDIVLGMKQSRALPTGRVVA